MKLRLMHVSLTVVFLLARGEFATGQDSQGQTFQGPDTVVCQSGPLTLRALLWRPSGQGPFPAVLFNHGSGRAFEPHMALGPVFARHGYAFLFLFRRGAGLSVGQGVNSDDLLQQVLADEGQEARDEFQVHLLETDHLDDALAGVRLLRSQSDIDPKRVAVVGHSFGGSLALLLAERDSSLRAAVDFAGGAASWTQSLSRRERMIKAVGRIAIPVFFIQAANDYSVEPARALSSEMARLGKRYRMKIYPPVGETADEGHAFVHLGVSAWEVDVFDFLAEQMKP